MPSAFCTVSIQKVAVVDRTFALNPVDNSDLLDRNRAERGRHSVPSTAITQRVLLVFNGLVWPHVSVATLT